MTTTRTRLSTYVDAETAELVRTTAEALDQTTSALLADMVSYGVPMLEVLRDMAIGIKQAPDEARARVAAMAAATRPLVDALYEDQARLAALGQDPPPSNRGVTR